MNDTDPTPEPTRCPECTAYHGYHVLDCSQQTYDEMRAQVREYHAAWLREHQSRNVERNRLKEQVTLWQGKHALLRHENNKLRKKIEKLPAEQSEIVARLRQLSNYWNRFASDHLRYAEKQGITNREILAEMGRLGRCASDLEQLLDKIAPEVKP